tara:strand:+ start:2600 stop:3994 length:1395 start_codon:yes stop_codon:yes gene_type:complete
MTVLYGKEKAKYGNLTGQIIIWPVEYQGTPEDANNVRNLPAGYLRCDGTIYYAEDYPQLASILGTGEQTKFLRRNLDQTAFDFITDEQFMVPDFGSKYPEPTSGANAGVYDNIRTTNALGTEISRGGIGVEIASAIGQDVTIQYSGSISVPSQEIEVRGKPSWNYAGETHRTDIEGVEENAVHPHAHFGTWNRSRNLQVNETDSQNPIGAGRTGRRNASTVPIQTWLDATRYNNDPSFPPGSAQEPCKAIDPWGPGDNGGPTSIQGFGLQQTVYYGHCIFGAGAMYTYNCISNSSYTMNRHELSGSADGQNVSRFCDVWRIWVILTYICAVQGNCGNTKSATLTVPVTYSQGAQGVPDDYAGNSLYDVLPLQSNGDVNDNTCTPDVDNEISDTTDLPREGGVDPTSHNHRIDIVKGDHTYKVKTSAISIPPENLKTTMSIGVDSSVSIDSAAAPFIVMEYLIKI